MGNTFNEGESLEFEPIADGTETEPNFLTADQILGADDRRFEIVEVPEWGGHVRIRTLSGTERDQFESAIVQQTKMGTKVDQSNIRARFACFVICDAQGDALFTHRQVMTLGRKNSKALDRIFEAGMEFNGMTQKEVDELTENLENGQSEDSITD